MLKYILLLIFTSTTEINAPMNFENIETPMRPLNIKENGFHMEQIDGFETEENCIIAAKTLSAVYRTNLHSAYCLVVDNVQN